jgi:hypothetical protein
MYLSRKRLLIASGTFVVSLVVLAISGHFALRSFFYPKPSGLPPIVDQPIEKLLGNLQSVLERRAPVVAKSLQPGLSDSQINDLEARGGFRLNNDLRALYSWRNGMQLSNNIRFIPGHWFYPLEKVVTERNLEEQQLKSGALLQRIATCVFAGHRQTWISVMPDGASDGYFYDPERADTEGAFFFHFSQGGEYVWFPSFRNFLSGVIDAYEGGAFYLGTNKTTLEEDPDRTQNIWSRLGAVRN